VPRLLSILGFLAFMAGAVSLAVAVYILVAGVIGWNPFSHGRPLIAGVTTMVVMLVVGLVLLVAGVLLAQASARALAQREVRNTLPA